MLLKPPSQEYSRQATSGMNNWRSDSACRSHTTIQIHMFKPAGRNQWEGNWAVYSKGSKTPKAWMSVSSHPIGKCHRMKKSPDHKWSVHAGLKRLTTYAELESQLEDTCLTVMEKQPQTVSVWKLLLWNKSSLTCSDIVHHLIDFCRANRFENLTRKKEHCSCPELAIRDWRNCKMTPEGLPIKMWSITLQNMDIVSASSHQVCWATRQDPSNSNSLSMTLLLSGRTKRTLITHCTHQRQSAPWPVTWMESNAQGCIWTGIMTLVKSFAQWISAFKMHWANWKQLNQNSTSKVHQNHQASTMEPRSSVLKMTTVHHQHKSKPNLSKESSESSSS